MELLPVQSIPGGFFADSSAAGGALKSYLRIFYLSNR
jgi:hypothetical protein